MLLTGQHFRTVKYKRIETSAAVRDTDAERRCSNVIGRTRRCLDCIRGVFYTITQAYDYCTHDGRFARVTKLCSEEVLYSEFLDQKMDLIFRELIFIVYLSVWKNCQTKLSINDKISRK